MVGGVKVGTWNVAYGRGPIVNQRRRSELDRHPADVWVLTETHASLSPGDDYESFSTHARPAAGNAKLDHDSAWVTIWAKSMLRPRLLEDVTSDPVRTVAVAITIDQRSVAIYGTVLPWYTDSGPRTADMEIERQAKEWSACRGDHAGLIVAGDFNLDLGLKHYYGSARAKAAMRGALRDNGLSAVTTSKHHVGHCGPNKACSLIDHIAATGRLAQRGTTNPIIFGPRTIDNKPLSDHSGVVVDLDLLWPTTP